MELCPLFTPEEAGALEAAIDERMRLAGVESWNDGVGIISSPDGMRVVNFGAMPNNKQFRDLVKDAAGTLGIDTGRLQYFASDGALVANDWKENPNGEIYQSRISETYGPDLLRWVGDFLAPRVQAVFNEYSARHGWGDPGSFDGIFPAEGPQSNRYEQ